MAKIITNLETVFTAIRVGRAHPRMLDSVRVEYYGTFQPLNQMANVNIANPQELLIKPYDPQHVNAVVTAINKSQLDLNPVAEATVVRIKIPPLTGERRELLIKKVNKEAETFRVKLRQVRRQAKQQIKTAAANEEEIHLYEAELQKITDEFVEKANTLAAAKAEDLAKI